jgi:hypothetical protein
MSFFNRNKPSGGSRKPDPFRTMDCAQFLFEEFPPQECLIDPWLPKQGLVMVYAERGIGKTFFALQIALTIASGGQFLNWRTPKPHRVLYLDGEMQASQLQDRISQLTSNMTGEQLARFVLMPCGLQKGAMPDLSLRSSQLALEPYLADIDLIIMDNISCLCRTGVENEAESWRPVQDWLLSQRAAGRSVMLIHHSGKGGAQRGTSKREDILDTVVKLQRPDGYSADLGAEFEVHFEKARGFAGSDAKAQVIRLQDSDTGLVWTTTGTVETTFDKVVKLLNSGLDQSRIAQELMINKSTVSRHVKQAREIGAIESDSVRQSPLI